MTEDIRKATPEEFESFKRTVCCELHTRRGYPHNRAEANENAANNTPTPKGAASEKKTRATRRRKA